MPNSQQILDIIECVIHICVLRVFGSLFRASLKDSTLIFRIYPPNFKNSRYNNVTMTPQDWLGVTLTALSILVIVGGAIRWVLRTYITGAVESLKELKPNGGSSLKDQISRLEEKVDKLFDMMIEHLQNHNK